MSMTEQYDPYENAVAERINRTLKYEYGLKQTIKNTKLAQKITKQAGQTHTFFKLIRLACSCLCITLIIK